MLTGRPLLYVSLPSVAFILGVYWYHRRNKRTSNDGGGGNKSNFKTDEQKQQQKKLKNKQKQDSNDHDKYKPQNGLTNGNIPTTTTTTNKSSRSMSINGGIGHHKHGQPDIDDDIQNASIKQFGKSAPINIIPNGGSRVSPIANKSGAGLQTNVVDSEVLKSKIQDAEHKILRSIDEDFENLSSPVDLPDSIQNNRSSFYAVTRHVNIKRDEPVVIKATTTPKISPENSFLESKYVKSPEQNNNADELPSATTTISATTRALSQSPREQLNKTDIALPVIEEAQKSQQQQSQEQEQQQNIQIMENHIQTNSNTSDVETTTTTTVTDTSLTATETATTTIAATETSSSTATDDKRKEDVASPSLSLCSEQSGDSGKGSSLPRSEAIRAKTTYEFYLPTSLVGSLIGRKRFFIKKLESVAGVKVKLLHERNTELLNKHVRICVLEGTESQINVAVNMIRQRLPSENFPFFNLERIRYPKPQSIVPLSTESLLNLQLNLIEGINNDVAVSAVISGGHIFVQHPCHPTHPSLSLLQKGLYDSYTGCETPLLPSIEISAVCVTCINGVWYRVQIVAADTEDDQRCIVKFLDFGGYMNVHFSDLRQIRTDFMTLPFQATECILSNLEPIDGFWTPEAADILCKLTKGIVLQAQVAGYNSHNVPEIYLFACLGPNVSI